MTNSLKATTIKRVRKQIGRTFREPELLLQALTHKSFANESPGMVVAHNERLEFLGDSVLGLVVSTMLMEKCPDVGEGVLSRMRAACVNKRELARAAGRLGLGELLRLGKGEERSGGREKESLLANTFEALLGATFLDGGLVAVRRVIRRALGDRVTELSTDLPGFDPKSRLQEAFQRQRRPPPCYCLVESSGPDHQRRFKVSVTSGVEELGSGDGPSKKDAEQAAARKVLESLAERERASAGRKE